MATENQDSALFDAVVNGTLDSYNESQQPAAETPAGEAPAPEPTKTTQQTGDDPAPAAAETDKPAPAATDKSKAEGSEQPLDLNAMLLKISGGAIKSEDDFKAFLQERQAKADLESRAKTLETENTQLKAQVNTSPFANDYLKKLNSLYQEGASEDQVNAFITLNRAGDLTKLDPLEVRKLALQLNERLTPEEAEIAIKHDYKLDPEQYDEAEVNAAKVQLKRDVRKDLELLEKHKAEISETPQARSAKDAEVARTAYLQRVEPIAKNIVGELSIIKGFSVNGKDGDGAILVDLETTEESRKNLTEMIGNFAAASEVDLNDEGVAKLRDFAKSYLAVHNWENWLRDVDAKADARVRAEFHNPSPIQRGQDNPTQEKSSKEKDMDWVLANT